MTTKFRRSPIYQLHCSSEPTTRRARRTGRRRFGICISVIKTEGFGIPNYMFSAVYWNTHGCGSWENQCLCPLNCVSRTDCWEVVSLEVMFTELNSSELSVAPGSPQDRAFRAPALRARRKLFSRLTCWPPIVAITWMLRTKSRSFFL
jgi:hypothetical protein